MLGNDEGTGLPHHTVSRHFSSESLLLYSSLLKSCKFEFTDDTITVLVICRKLYLC